MNTKEQQDKEYRAQWMRDAARDILMARESTEACSTAEGPVSRKNQLEHCASLASSLWDRYEQERDVLDRRECLRLVIEAQLDKGRKVRISKKGDTVSIGGAAEGEIPEYIGHGPTLLEAAMDAAVQR